jgi:hypothetical protein
MLRPYDRGAVLPGSTVRCRPVQRCAAAPFRPFPSAAFALFRVSAVLLEKLVRALQI